jgi:hypothetical protein
MDLAIIVFTSLEGPAPAMSGKEAITKRTPGALSPGKFGKFGFSPAI